MSPCELAAIIAVCAFASATGLWWRARKLRYDAQQMIERHYKQHGYRRDF